jgi:Glycosyltransferase family 87
MLLDPGGPCCPAIVGCIHVGASTIADEQAAPGGSGVPNDKTQERGISRLRDMTEGAFFRDRLAARLERWSGRPTLVAVAAMNAITGLAAAAILAPVAFGADANAFRGCALWVAEGRTDFCGFLYAPPTALVARPLTWVSPTGAAVVMTLLGLAILVAGVRLETRGRAPVDRVLIAVAALGFAPVVYELLLGQTTLLIAAALYPVVRRADAFRNGVPLGIVLALAPKPLLVPVLVWMMVWRRRALTSALVAALMLVCLGLVLLGPDQYWQWLSVLTGAGSESLSGTFSLSLNGNFSLWPLDPARIALAAAVGLATLWVILREPSRGFVAALLAGLLLAPYTGLYAASVLLLAVKPALAFAPRATRVLALIANPALGLLLALAAWSMGGLVACLPLPRPPSPRP